QQTETLCSRVLKAMADKFKELVKDPTTYLDILNLIAGILKGQAKIDQGKAKLTQAAYSDQLAQTEREVANFTAAYDFLKSSLPGIDLQVSEMTGKDGDIQQAIEFTQSMIDLCSSMTQDFGSLVEKAAKASQGK